ncbi:MAG: aquaporin [Gemmataceae bacterium]
MDRLLPAAIAEATGTFFFCFIGAASIVTGHIVGQDNLLAVAVAHGLALSIVVTATMNISGGHINPAVSVMFWMFERMTTTEFLAYVGSQLLGATVAGGVLLLLFGSSAEPAALGTPHINTTLLQASNPESLWGRYQVPATAVGIELVLTAFLVFAILLTAVDERAPRIGGFGIGLAVAADILVGGPLTGASMNPARTFGPGIWEAGAFGWDKFRDHAVYWIGPILGALIAGGIYFKLLAPRASSAK